MASSSSPSPNTSRYILGQDFYAACRLNAQHYTWQQELQFNLHPDIPAPKDGARVADVAAGTGAWLLETARSFPNVQFDGFDISLSQCPPKQYLPSNVDFNKWDMFEDPPEELVGKYDIVHLRLVILVIQTAAVNNPVLTLKNVAKLLKPGGYLQWDELDLTHTVILPADGDSPKVDGIKRMDARMKTTGGFKWVPALPEIINSNGFENAMYHQIRPRFELMKFNTDIILLSWVELAKRAQEPERKKFCWDLVEEVWEECQNDALYGTAKAVIVARKYS